MLIKISLEVTPQQLIAIGELLQTTVPHEHQVNRPRTFHDDSQEQVVAKPSKEPTEDVRPSHVKPVVMASPDKKIVMPAFGRSQEELDAFDEVEQVRFDKKTEKELLKEEKALEKKEALKVSKAELESIQDAIKPTPHSKEFKSLGDMLSDD